MNRITVVLSFVVGLVVALIAQGDPKADETILRTAGIKADDNSLLDVFRSRTLTAKERDRLADLVVQLGADEFDDRERATKGLLSAGCRALVVLRPALKDDDAERRRRALRCVRAIESRPEVALLVSAASLARTRKPAGAAEVLLAYLPFAEDEEVVEEVFSALRVVGWRDGKREAALDRAIKGATMQRSAVAYVLGRSDKVEERNLAAVLLKDTDEEVRWRAAESLTWGRDVRGVPELLVLVEKGSAERAAQAEDLLGRIAGVNAPSGADAWRKWWRENESKIDLGKVNFTSTVRGIRLVADHRGEGGCVWEYGSDRAERWKIEGVGFPVDVRALPGGKLLVAEDETRRVTERDRTGKVLWEHRLKNEPIEVQKLRGGRVLIATNYEIVEVDRGGNVVTTHIRDRGGNICSAQILHNGHLLYGLYSGQVIELDRAGKEVRQFEIERPRGLMSIEALGDGKYLIPYPRTNRVVEIDGKGRVQREIEAEQPTSVSVLPDGNLLVGSHIRRTVSEIDRKGKVLWTRTLKGQVFRVRVR